MKHLRIFNKIDEYNSSEKKMPQISFINDNKKAYFDPKIIKNKITAIYNPNNDANEINEPLLITSRGDLFDSIIVDGIEQNKPSETKNFSIKSSPNLLDVNEHMFNKNCYKAEYKNILKYEIQINDENFNITKQPTINVVSDNILHPISDYKMINPLPIDKTMCNFEFTITDTDFQEFDENNIIGAIMSINGQINFNTMPMSECLEMGIVKINGNKLEISSAILAEFSAILLPPNTQIELALFKKVNFDENNKVKEYIQFNYNIDYIVTTNPNLTLCAEIDNEKRLLLVPNLYNVISIENKKIDVDLKMLSFLLESGGPGGFPFSQSDNMEILACKEVEIPQDGGFIRPIIKYNPYDSNIDYTIGGMPNIVFVSVSENDFMFNKDIKAVFKIKNNVTDMNGMFANCTNLTSLDLSNLDTSKVTNMGGMFYNCSGLQSLDLSNFNTSKVTDMNGMFANCTNLTSVDLSNFDTSKVTNMNSMFYDCRSLTELDLSNFNTSKVTDMNSMFYDCRSLTSLDLSNFNTSKVTDMGGMFYNCSGLQSLDLSNFDTSKTIYMGSMFYGCRSLTSLDLSNFNTSKVTNMGYMFYNCSSLTSVDLSNFDTSNVIGMYYMFSSCRSLKEIISLSSNPCTFTSDIYLPSGLNGNIKTLCSLVEAYKTSWVNSGVFTGWTVNNCINSVTP